MSILTKKRTSKDYKEKLASLGVNTKENVQAAVNNFKKFVQEKHQSTLDKICKKLIEIRKIKVDEEYEDTLYNFLQSSVGFSCCLGSRNCGNICRDCS